MFKQAYGTMEWLNNWEEGFIEHEKQLDGKSCGIHVVEVKQFDILSRKENALT